jgi:oligosaccharide repeat unit polymerase
MPNPFKLSVTSPAFIIVFITGAMLFVNLFILNESWEWGHTLFVSAVLCFVVFYVIVILLLFGVGNGIKSKIPSQGFEASSSTLKIYWALSLIGLLLSLYRIYAFGLMGDKGAILLNLRYAYIWEDHSNYGAQHFSLFALCLALYYAQRVQLLVCAAAGLIYLISALSLAERTSMLFLFASVVYTLVSARSIGVRGIVSLFSIMIGLFVIVAVGTGRADDERPYEFILSYFGYAVTAFSHWLDGKEYQGCADLVFGKIINVLTLGFYSCEAFDVGFSDDDFNVLTFMANPFLFGGTFMVLLSMSALGGWFGLLRFLAEKRAGYFLAILSCYVYALVMIFYAWQFSLSTYFYVALILIPLFYNQLFGKCTSRKTLESAL